MKTNERALLAACIDTGIYAGWIRAHKHDDAPHELRIQEEIDTAIWYEIDQYFVFDSERDLCDEVVEGFDELEQEEVDRLRAKKKEIYEDLKDAVDDAVDREWTQLFEGSKDWRLCSPSERVEWLLSMYQSVKEDNERLEEMLASATEAPKREWVGLTNEEVEEAVSFPWHYIPFARAIEAKLKEKNNG